jgi:hypothetical protein
VENHEYDGSEGEFRDAMGGSMGLGDPSRRSGLLRCCCSGVRDRGRSEDALVFELSLLEGPSDSRCVVGDGPLARVRTLDAEYLDDAEKDCSKGLGSRSKFERSGLGGGRMGIVASGGAAPDTGGVGSVI